jgi:BirA family biotin operon repressor/biotin-[acetyl-CoA-carboxylase] ligase
MALAARSACARATGVEAGLKWPNDLIVGERKLAGILAEVVDEVVVVGIGVNVAWPPPQGEEAQVAVPDELAQATSLWRESGIRIEPAALLEMLLGELDGRLDDLATAAGRRRLASDYRSACSTLGRRVTVTLEGETVTGAVTDITTEGHLLVDVGACIRTITAGDVVHLRT